MFVPLPYYGCTLTRLLLFFCLKAKKVHFEFAVSGDSADDWHLIQRSADLQAAVADLEPDRRAPVLLAPLPSADASEAEHWARAMSTASGSSSQLSSRVLAAAADRLRHLRRLSLA